MDNIVNYVKADRSIVLKFEVFLHAAKKRQAMMMMIWHRLHRVNYSYATLHDEDERPWPCLNYFFMACSALQMYLAH